MDQVYLREAAVEFATLFWSLRGELEISDIHCIYLNRGKLSVEFMGRGYAWLDTHTLDRSLDAEEFMRLLEKHQGFKIASSKEIAFRRVFIGVGELETTVGKLGKSDTRRVTCSAYWRRRTQAKAKIEPVMSDTPRCVPMHQHLPHFIIAADLPVHQGWQLLAPSCF
ncbi:hypothetical protein [Novosphingobium sp.]|uniref:hypothetical protein n=1 Tax=Novosphingobium sp. TaxID=1874826 RepID=UPI002FE3718F